MKKHLLFVLALSIVIFPFVAGAQTNTTLINQLKAEVVRLQTRLQALIQTTTVNQPTAVSNLSGYTANLLKTAAELRQAATAGKPAITARLIELARARKAAALKTMADNPQAVITNALPDSTRAQLPPEVLNLVEERRQIRGTFEWLHSDNFETGVSRDEFFVAKTETNKIYEVRIAGNPRAKTGDTVRLDGVVLDDQIALTQNSIELLGTVSVGATAASGDKITKKVLVLLVNFTGDTREPWTISEVRKAIFTDSDSVNKYYQEASFDQWSLVGKLRSDGDIYGWFTLPYDGSDCQYRRISVQADEAAQSAGINLDGYDNIIYVWPNKSCGFDGRGSLGGSPGRSYINGLNVGVINHELGHNYSMHHASSYSCFLGNGSRISVGQPQNCTSLEYGDRFSVMGNAAQSRQHNNYHKGLSGAESYFPNWLKLPNTLTINRNAVSDATYTITPVESFSEGIKSLRIPMGTSHVEGKETSNYYYLEFRQPLGLFDNFNVSDHVVNGVLIRIAPDYNDFFPKSLLVDATPGTSDFFDAALAPGRTLVDSYENIKIETLSVTPSGARVRVYASALQPRRVQIHAYDSDTLADLVDVEVSIYRADNGQSVATLYTDANGFAVSALPPGVAYGFVLRKNGYEDSHFSHFINSGITSLQFAGSMWSVITPTITVTSPQSGDVWPQGETRQIRWTSQGFLGNEQTYVDLIGTRYGLASGSSLMNDGRVTAVMPNDVAPGNYRIKVTSVLNYGSVVTGYSDNYFTVIAATILPAITLTAPTGVSYTTTQSVRVAWTTTNAPVGATVSLRLKDANNVQKGSAGGLAGSYFDFPLSGLNLAAGTYRFEAELRNGPEILARATGSNFTITDIAPSSITITAPTASTIWQSNVAHNITWTSQGLDVSTLTNIIVYTSTGSVYYRVLDLTNSGSYTVPANTFRAAGAYYFTINAATVSVRSEIFTVVAAPIIVQPLPVLIPTPTLTLSDPPTGAIDARDESVSSFGSLALTFSAPVSGLATTDFTVASTNAAGPPATRAVRVDSANPAKATLFLTRPLTARERVTITHKPSGSSVCLGFLPGNVNQDAYGPTASDLSLLNAWVGTADGLAKPLWQTDINRDGIFDAKDVTRLGEMFSAATSLGRIGACPPPAGGVVSTGAVSSQSQLANVLSALRAALGELSKLMSR